MTDAELETLVNSLHETLNGIFRLEPRWRENGGWPEGETGSILNPPATAEDIRAFEERSGRHVPPSYARFLRLHDGWRHFWMDFTLMGARPENSERVLKEVTEMVAWQDGKLEQRLGSLAGPEVAAWEKQDPSRTYLRRRFPFAADFAGSLFLFDSPGDRPGVEPPIRHWSIANGASHEGFFESDYLGAARLDNFDEMLASVVREAEGYLAKLQGKRARKAKSQTARKPSRKKSEPGSNE